MGVVCSTSGCVRGCFHKVPDQCSPGADCLLAQERIAGQMRDVVAIARSLKRCTTFSQVDDLADVLIARCGPPSEAPALDEGSAP